VIGALFSHFAESGSVRAVWLWLLGEGLSFPLQQTAENTWPSTPTHRQVNEGTLSGAAVHIS
jgi:hypothetical protein